MKIPHSNRVKLRNGELSVRMAHNADDGTDLFFFHGPNVSKRDANLMYCVFSTKCLGEGFGTLYEELEKRGYDLSTLRFSISKASASDS